MDLDPFCHPPSIKQFSTIYKLRNLLENLFNLDQFYTLSCDENCIYVTIIHVKLHHASMAQGKY